MGLIPSRRIVTLFTKPILFLHPKILHRLESHETACYVHAGSSSEYGEKASGPTELDLPDPNSDYSVSKVACANLISYMGRKKHFPCANLRLYSVYGPLEDSSRLILKLFNWDQGEIS